MKKFLHVILTIATLGIFVLVFRVPLHNNFALLLQRYLPCREPIAYSVGSFDNRFNISQTDFLQAVKEAESIWEKPLGKELFSHKAGGNLTINLIYDNRQAATIKLKALGLTLSDNQASYDALKAKYDALKGEYAAQKVSYDALVSTFTSREDAYNAEVAQSNARGGANQREYARLTAEKNALEVDAQKIHQLESTLNANIDDINALVIELNRVATLLNLNVGEFNQIGASRGEEFNEGLYQSGPDGQSIAIYQFDTRAKLVRVLAHELGHALGLEHVSDPKAIMYRLNQGTNEKLTEADLTALKTRCGIK